MDDRSVRQRVERVEQALEALERLPDEPRRTALDAVRALVELYGEGWQRALARLEKERPGDAARLAEDELVAHLLMIHGLHPTDVESRVRGALERVWAAASVEAVEVELLGIEEGVACLRFAGDGGAPAPGLFDLVEEAVLGAAPELDRVDIETPRSANEGAEGEDGPVQRPRAGREAERAEGER